MHEKRAPDLAWGENITRSLKMSLFYITENVISLTMKKYEDEKYEKSRNNLFNIIKL